MGDIGRAGNAGWTAFELVADLLESGPPGVEVMVLFHPIAFQEILIVGRRVGFQHRGRVIGARDQHAGAIVVTEAGRATQRRHAVGAQPFAADVQQLPGNFELIDDLEEAEAALRQAHVRDAGVVDKGGNGPQLFPAPPGHEEGDVSLFVEKAPGRIEVFEALGD